MGGKLIQGLIDADKCLVCIGSLYWLAPARLNGVRALSSFADGWRR
jgi:hypothetical protein